MFFFLKTDKKPSREGFFVYFYHADLIEQGRRGIMLYYT